MTPAQQQQDDEQNLSICNKITLAIESHLLTHDECSKQHLLQLGFEQPDVDRWFRLATAIARLKLKKPRILH